MPQYELGGMEEYFSICFEMRRPFRYRIDA